MDSSGDHLGDGDDLIHSVSEMSRSKKRKVESRPVPTISKLKSPTFNEFTFNDELQRWICNRCGSPFSHPKHGGATSLTRHLDSDHKGWKTGSESTSSSNQQDFNERPTLKPITREQFKHHLLKFIVTTNQPFSIVASTAFQELINFCSGGNPNCLLPCPMTVGRWIHELYIEEREKLKSELQNAPGKISFQVDGWTSKNHYSYQGVLANWIGSDWTLNTCLLDMAQLVGSHTGDIICDSFCKTMDDFDLWKKFLATTMDNAGNMNTFSDKLEEICKTKSLPYTSQKYRVRCLAHIINLVCKDVIRTICKLEPSNSSDEGGTENNKVTDNNKKKTLLVKIRDAIESIRSSTQRIDSYRKFCAEAKYKFKMLLPDNQTRWNSTYKMLTRLRERKEAYEATVNYIPELRMFSLTSEEWKKVETLIDVLKPFHFKTLEMSKGFTTTIGDTAAVYHELFEHLEKLSNNSENPPWLIEAALDGWAKLKKYYPSIDGLVHIAATAMDPRRKFAYLRLIGWDPYFIKQAEDELEELWNSQYKTGLQAGSEEQHSPYSEDASDLLYRKMCEVSELGTTGLDMEDELIRYINEKVVNPKYLRASGAKDVGNVNVDGALLWWQRNAAQFPQLSTLARDFLAVSATSVSLERAFSSGTDICRPKRQSLGPQTINELMCLTYWMKRDLDKTATTRECVASLKRKVLDEYSDDEED